MGCLKKQTCNWGFAVVAAAFIVNFISDGIRFSFGMFFAIFIETFEKDAETTAWVGSLMFAVLNFSAPICSIVVTKFGSRLSTVFGSLLCFLGFLTGALVPNLYFLYFSLGILTGFGISLMYVGQAVIVVKYFKANRTFAIGVSICSSGIGGIVFTFLMNILTKDYAWSGFMLILSGIMLQTSVAGMLMRPKGHLSDTGANKSSNSNNTLLSSTTNNSKNNSEDALEQLHHESDHSTTIENNEFEITKGHASFVEKSDQCDVRQTSDDHKCKLEKETVKSVYVLLLRDPKLYLLIVSQFFAAFGYMSVFMFIPVTALSMGHSKDRAAWLLTVANIANIISRLLTGIVADRKFISRSHMFILAMGFTGVVCIFFAVSSNVVLMILFCSLIGTGVGAFTTLFPVAITDIFGDDRISQVFGLSLFGRGPGNLIAPPLAGFILDITGSTRYVFIQCACAFLSASMLMVLCEKLRIRSR